jgi:hypothetical protein
MIVLAYKKRKKLTSGFEKFCKMELSRVKKARSHGSRAKTAHHYQKCLEKRGIKTGLSRREAKKLKGM